MKARSATLRKKLSIIVFVAMLAIVAAISPAAAQSDALLRLYDEAATIPTNIEGIRAYPPPPKGFNTLTASDEELAAYGIPIRPDKVKDPNGYRQWVSLAPLMSDPDARWYGELKPRKGRSNLGRVDSLVNGTTFSASKATGKAWSGVVNTLPLTSWSSSKSFKFVQGSLNVPWPQEAFTRSTGNICDGDTDQASLWVGLGGMTVTGLKLGNQNNILQSGVDIGADCSGPEFAYAWVEWFPAPAVVLFNVNPGDDIYVSVMNTSATSGGIYILDQTIKYAAGYSIKAPAGYELVGNEAEYVVERPAGDSNTPTKLYPLANYIWSFWAFADSEDFTGTKHYPGGTSSETFQLSMTDDSGGSVISFPTLNAGQQNMFVQDENCAFVGGCTP
jgi:Peptidase A4 family